jgi:hypothetical protein
MYSEADDTLYFSEIESQVSPEIAVYVVSEMQNVRLFLYGSGNSCSGGRIFVGPLSPHFECMNSRSDL